MAELRPRKVRGKKHQVSYRVWRCNKCDLMEPFPFDCECEGEE